MVVAMLPLILPLLLPLLLLVGCLSPGADSLGARLAGGLVGVARDCVAGFVGYFLGGGEAFEKKVNSRRTSPRYLPPSFESRVRGTHTEES